MFELFSSVLSATGAGILTSLCVAIGLVVSKKYHGHFSMDNTDGIQKFHTQPTPRIGGIAVFVGCLVSAIFLKNPDLALTMILCGLPAFGCGLLEDLTKKVSPRIRLIATMVSGVLFVVGAGSGVQFVETQWIDNLIKVNDAILVLGCVFLIFGMAGVANAINIIDGFHGLASGSMMIMLLCFAALAYYSGDVELAQVSVIFAGSIFGFLLINFPFGKIFLGDAGAYFGGFLVAAIAIAVTARNPEISPFTCLLVVFYPVYETLFSIVRKRRREGHCPSQPDGVHMHMLVARSVGKPLARSIGKTKMSNAMTGAVMWSASLIVGLFAVAVRDSSVMAVIGCIMFCLWYGILYRKISLQKQRYERKGKIVRSMNGVSS